MFQLTHLHVSSYLKVNNIHALTTNEYQQCRLIKFTSGLSTYDLFVALLCDPVNILNMIIQATLIPHGYGTYAAFKFSAFPMPDSQMVIPPVLFK